MKAESQGPEKARLYSLMGIVIIAVSIVAVISSLYLFFKVDKLEGDIEAKDSQLSSLQTQLILPVSQEEAIERAKKTFAFKNFSTILFEDPTQQVEMVSLVLDEESQDYQWKVELIERKCGCAEGEEGLNSIVFYIDPETGDVVRKEEHVGITEENYARETCEKACHTE
jgi:hypothetical protein